MCLTTEEM